jgi:uncharacterized protein (TIGR00251 family)
MPPRAYRFHDGQQGSALAIRVLPRAGRNEIAGVMADGTVRIRLTAAPVDGEANEQLLRFLAQKLKVPKSRIEIVAGLSGRNKLVAVRGLDAAGLHRRIAALLL